MGSKGATTLQFADTQLTTGVRLNDAEHSD